MPVEIHQIKPATLYVIDYSAWSEEDLQSNEAGAEFGLWWIRGGRHKRMLLSKGIDQFLTHLGAVRFTDDLLGKPYFERLPESEGAYEKEWLSRALKDNQTVVEINRRMRNAAGWTNVDANRTYWLGG